MGIWRFPLKKWFSTYYNLDPLCCHLFPNVFQTSFFFIQELFLGAFLNILFLCWLCISHQFLIVSYKDMIFGNSNLISCQLSNFFFFFWLKNCIYFFKYLFLWYWYFCVCFNYKHSKINFFFQKVWKNKIILNWIFL